MSNGGSATGAKRQVVLEPGYSPPQGADASPAAVCEPDGKTPLELNAFTAAVDVCTEIPCPEIQSSVIQSPVVQSRETAAKPLHSRPIAIVRAASETLKKSWFWYSVAASLCWTAWAFTARAGSEEIPPATMQFISAFGFLLVGLVMLVVQRPQLVKSLRGNCYALVSGLLLGLGGIALYGAYRSGNNAAVVTAVTSLYPLATVLLAVTFLREKLNRLQLLGVCFAVAAILVLSL